MSLDDINPIIKNIKQILQAQVSRFKLRNFYPVFATEVVATVSEQLDLLLKQASFSDADYIYANNKLLSELDKIIEDLDEQITQYITWQYITYGSIFVGNIFALYNFLNGQTRLEYLLKNLEYCPLVFAELMSMNYSFYGFYSGDFIKIYTKLSNLKYESEKIILEFFNKGFRPDIEIHSDYLNDLYKKYNFDSEKLLLFKILNELESTSELMDKKNITSGIISLLNYQVKHK